MKIFQLQLGLLKANCYIIETAPGRCTAVDIGGDSAAFLEFLKNKKLNLSKILLTHGHFDHIGGVADIAEATGAEVFIHADDSCMLESAEASLASLLSLKDFMPVTRFTAVYDSSFIEDGEFTFKVIHTPGHTPGSVCYICNDVIFSGDTLFCGSIGRTDFPGSNPQSMRESLKILKNLKDDYHIYPGHNESTTLDYERKYNPYLSRV